MTLLSDYREKLEIWRVATEELAEAAEALTEHSVEVGAKRRWSKRSADLFKICVDVDKELENFAGLSRPAPGQTPLPFNRPPVTSTNGQHAHNGNGNGNHFEPPYNSDGAIEIYPRNYAALPEPVTEAVEGDYVDLSQVEATLRTWMVEHAGEYKSAEALYDHVVDHIMPKNMEVDEDLFGKLMGWAMDLTGDVQSPVGAGL